MKVVCIVCEHEKTGRKAYICEGNKDICWNDFVSLREKNDRMRIVKLTIVKFAFHVVFG